MSQNLNVYFSNNLDTHYEQLKVNLFAANPRSPFKRRLIVVYGPAMQSWLMLKMAQDPQLEIAMGIEFVYLNQAYEKLLHLGGQPHLHLPSTLEITLAIEKELYNILSNYENLPQADQNEWEFLLSYLHLKGKDANKPLTSKMEKRIVGLSQHLALLFRDYGLYGKPLLEQWENNESLDWQKRLWEALFNSETGWIPPLKALSLPTKPLTNCEVHFFSISFVCKAEFAFLTELSFHTPIHYYLLSPCATFWSDIRSDKESSQLYQFWQRKGKGSSDEMLQLEEFLRDRNTLLANFGRLGREMVTQIELSHAQTVAHYSLPASLAEIDADLFVSEDLTLTETDQPLTLLKAIQGDMLLLRNPDGGTVYDLPYPDTSIQLHQTPTRRREVQILYHNLLNIIENHPTIQPCDIIVMAPQIGDYVPYIRSQFGSQQSLLDFQLLDLGMQNQNEIVQGFLQLVALSQSRWDVSHVLELFENQAFQRKHHVSMNDINLLKRWIQKAGILWGENIEHRNEILQRQHCQKETVETKSVGTWDFGFTRLLLGLTNLIEDQQAPLPLGHLPCDNMEFSNADLLNKWIRFIHSLRDDLAPLQDGTKLSMEDWSHYLKCLLESYFQQDYDELQSISDYEDLVYQFDALRQASTTFKDALFPYYSVHTHLDNLLKNRGITFRENHIQAVRFCSMMPLRSIPAKVIALLGMEEGAFPRQNQYSSLNRMNTVPECDYCPLTTDYDRYLFLEAIHSTHEFLLLSYQGYSSKDQKELKPCLLVEELYSYLEKNYSIQDKKISQRCIFKHPFDSFNRVYFEEGTCLANYSLQDYQAALAYYQAKTPPHTYLKTFHTETHVEIVNSFNLGPIAVARFIEVKHLSALARNPIKFHLNRGMDIYLKNGDERNIPNEENLELSFLTKFQLKEKALREPISHLLSHVEKMGKMPLGLFKEVAENSMHIEGENIQAAYRKHDIQQNQIFQIEFSQNCKRVEQVQENLWLLPAPCIEVNGAERIIIGKLPMLSPKGMLTLAKSSIDEMWKIWPQFLLYRLAMESLPLKLEPQVIALYAAKPKKAFFEDPLPYLKSFVRYYDQSHKQISPLMPEWVAFIAKQNADGLRKKMEESFDRGTIDSVNWVLSKNNLPCSKAIIQTWKPHLDVIAGDLFKAWASAKAKDEDEE